MQVNKQHFTCHDLLINHGKIRLNHGKLIFLTASIGLSSLCEKLLDIVDDKKPRDTEGNTPLGLAAKNGHLDALKVIGNRVGYE